MNISNIKISNNSMGTLLSAKVDNFDLRFQYNGTYSLPYMAETVLLSCLVPAMYRNQDIVVDSDFPISELLLENLEQFQNIFSAWFDFLNKIAINCSTKSSELKSDLPADGRVLCFFSGGLDSMHTFTENKSEIDCALFIEGFDIKKSEAERLQKARELNKEIIEHENGKEFISVETNLKLLEPNVPVYSYFGSAYTAMALAFGFKKLLIPASEPYTSLLPNGSHPLTDVLFSTEQTKIIHHGAVSRVEKLLALKDNPEALDKLRICNSSELYNCGECEKCLRTMVPMKLLGLKSKELPKLTDESIRHLKKLKVFSALQIPFWEENWELAKSKSDKKLIKILGKIVVGYKLRTFINELDRIALNGKLAGLRSKIRTKNAS